MISIIGKSLYILCVINLVVLKTCNRSAFETAENKNEPFM